MELTASTDLTRLLGQSVLVSGFRVVHVEEIHHGRQARREALRGGVWGLWTEEPRADGWGGRSAFFLPYGTDVTPST